MSRSRKRAILCWAKQGQSAKGHPCSDEKYPINISLIDYCLSEGLFELKDKELSPKLIQRFSSAHLEHIHFEKGKVE